MKDLDDLAERLLDIICDINGSDLRQEHRLQEIQNLLSEVYPELSNSSVTTLSKKLYSALFGDLNEDKET